jgi:hypothetical protein
MTTDNPSDWFRPFDNGEPGYWITREGIIFFAMKTEGRVATQAQIEIVAIVTAWYRGQILPRGAAPTVSMLMEVEPADPQPEPKPAPVEIVGGVAGLNRLLVKMAEENRGLDPAVLKELYQSHQVVTAVWSADDKGHGHGFYTMKGAEYLMAQTARGHKKVRATMTAIWCNNKEHAELLRQAFSDREQS